MCSIPFFRYLVASKTLKPGGESKIALIIYEFLHLVAFDSVQKSFLKRGRWQLHQMLCRSTCVSPAT